MKPLDPMVYIPVRYYGPIEALSETDQAALLRALIAYTRGEEKGEMSLPVSILYDLMIHDIDEEVRLKNNRRRGGKRNKPAETEVQKAS